MYAGFELLEHEAVAPGSEEYLHSEKYEIKIRDWDSGTGIAGYITRLNDLRRRHPALQQLRNLHVHGTDDETVLCFSKRAGDDAVVVVIDLDPGAAKTVRLSIEPADLGLRGDAPFLLQDEWSNQATTADAVKLSAADPARIFAVTPAS
jgi:starch synthase (maltosyl-transferring)